MPVLHGARHRVSFPCPLPFQVQERVESVHEIVLNEHNEDGRPPFPGLQLD